MLRLTPMTRDAWSMGSLHVELHGVRALAAHDNRLGGRHCLQCPRANTDRHRLSTFLRYYLYLYVRVIVEVMCGCNRGRVSGHTVNRRPVGRMQSHVVAHVAHVAHVVPHVSVPSPPQIRPPMRQQSRFPNQLRGRFQPAVVVPLYNPETTVWGPPLWKVLHTLAECSDNSPLWHDILTAMETLIPCPTCKAHFIEYRNQNPAPADHQGIVDWFFILHNIVNARLNKPLYDAAGLPRWGNDPSGDKASLLAGIAPIIQGLSVSYPPEFIALLQQMSASLV